MASFRLTPDRRNHKCQSLNSPVVLNGFTRNKKLRAEALGWDGWKDKSFEGNQSLLRNLPFRSAGKGMKMDWIKNDSVNMSSLSAGSKKIVNQSPVHASSSRDETWLLFENFFTSSSISSHSMIFGSNLPYVSPNKAIFTILLPCSQILVVNSAACKLLNYNSEELCSMKLENLLHERHKQKIRFLDETETGNPSKIIFNNGKIIELINKDGSPVPVSLYLNKLDTPEKCLVLAEPVERRIAVLTVDRSGKILSCDEEVAVIFQYDTSELIGVDLHDLIPSIQFDEDGGQFSENNHKQKVTGRTRDGVSFPLSVIANRSSPSQESWQVIMWIYSNLSGLIVLNKDLVISNCNHHFTKLLFGLPKSQVINQKITKLIPNFCEDVEYGRDEAGTLYQSDNSDSCSDRILVSDLDKKSIDDQTEEVSQSQELSVKDSDDGSCNLKTWTDSEVTGNVQLSKSNDEMNSKCDIQSADYNIKVISKKSEMEDSLNEINEENLDDNLELEKCVINDAIIKEGNFSGYGKHIDGANIDIIYKVKTVVLNDDTFYCVWISRDPWEMAEGGRNIHTNLTLTSSFNSTSMEGSLTKDSYHSEHNTRPSSASIISQCDEILTAGEYSEHYTNLQQIGKGAFGYVKMAYRNSDGFLVVTKFIKKLKINVRSWVVDPHLNMKVPLEISLLTTLDHPNIVKVLDVFHNESFFQLVMEKHGAGLDLFEFIDRKPKADEKLKSFIFRQIVSAVHYLDSLGILHRDIKDENVIINEKFEVKLIDFGSATFMTPDRMFSVFYGTVEYCSPEVLQGNKYKGPELDIWALGVTLYVLTFGENPFYDVGETIKGKFSIPAPISSQLYELLHRMLEKDVEARITINKLINDPWLNQPVDIDQYRFEDVVRCYHDEAYPPQYVYELCSDRDENHLEKGLDVDGDRTVASSNSFCSLHTLENLDTLDHYADEVENDIKINVPGDKLTISSSILSSTPVKKDRESLTKSAGSLHKTSENFPANQNHEYCNNNSIQKRFSLDLNVLAQMNNSSNKMPENPFKKGDDREAEKAADLETEIMKELNKLSLIENGNDRLDEISSCYHPRKSEVENRKSKTETTGSEDGSHETECHEFYDTVDHRNFDGGDFECYWDAEDEKYDNDDSFS